MRRPFSLWLITIQASQQIRASKPPQGIVNRFAGFGFIPEEKLTLRQFLGLCARRIHLFHGVGMITGVIDFSGKSHGRRREVLYLLQMEIELPRLCSKLSHIFFMASGMR